MTTAKLIAEIIELDQKIDNGMELSDLLDGDSLSERYDERVSNDMECLFVNDVRPKNKKRKILLKRGA